MFRWISAHRLSSTVAIRVESRLSSPASRGVSEVRRIPDIPIVSSHARQGVSGKACAGRAEDSGRREQGAEAAEPCAVVCVFCFFLGVQTIIPNRRLTEKQGRPQQEGAKEVQTKEHKMRHSKQQNNQQQS